MTGRVHRNLLFLLVVGMQLGYIIAQGMRVAVEGGGLTGRVQFYYYSKPGLVCADSFTQQDAAAVCRIITGRPGTKIAPRQINSSEWIWLQGLRCPRTVSRIQGCTFIGWQPRHCNMGAAAVSCQRTPEQPPPPVQPPPPIPAPVTNRNNAITVTLEGGSDANSGRVVVSRNNLPGTICQEGFDPRAVRVICRMLGKSSPDVSVQSFGPGTGRILKVMCNGNETSLSQCLIARSSGSTCTHAQDVGIVCGGSTHNTSIVPNITAPPTPAPETLSAPATPNIMTTLEPNGRIIINFENQGDGNICSDGFDINDAKVICQMFDLHVSPVQVMTFNESTAGGRVWLSDVQCTGSETSLYACRYRGFGNTTCRSASYAGVVCGNPTTISPCGIRLKGKVFGGTAAARGMWPWTVSLQNSNHTHFCGAVIIDRQWVITAAHCVYRFINSVSSVRVEVGSNNLRAGIHINVSRIVIHPLYKDIHFKHDIALLRLREHLNYSLVVQPICLNLEKEKLPLNRNCTVAGWGVTGPGQAPSNVLRAAPINIVNDTLCHRLPGYFDEVMLCAGHPNGERDACEGDSGGPLMCRRENTDVYDLYGTVSAGVACGTNHSGYAIYADISQYTAWIRSIISKNSVTQGSSCGLAPDVQYGKPSTNSTQLNTVVSYQCNLPYWLTHNNPLQCVVDSAGQPRWTPAPPRCSGDGCSTLPFGQGGGPNTTETRPGSVVSYQCARGYTPSHNNVLRCQAQSIGQPRWDNVPPKCNYSQCPDIPTIANAGLAVTSTRVGAQLTYRCNPGYILSHTLPVTCRYQPSGPPQWVGVSPQCAKPRHLGKTEWGNWGPVESCNAGTYVNGFRLKVESHQGIWKDDAAVTGIQFHCTDDKILTSNTLSMGSWRAWHYCPKLGLVSAVNFKSEPSQGRWTDDTAANNMNLRCIDGNNIGSWIYGDGLNAGGWNRAYCPGGQRVCSLQTLVEPHRGPSDDTGLNQISFTCCAVLPS